MGRRVAFCALMAAIFMLSGCESIQLAKPAGTSFPAPSPDTAQVRITQFGIPVDGEVGSQALHLLILFGGGQVDYPIGASVYDVTDGMKYLGNFSFGSSGGGSVYSFKNITGVPWIAYDTPPGRKTLMLVEAPYANSIADTSDTPLRQVDFIQFDAKPGKTEQIVLTRHGTLYKPYFNEIAMSPANRKFCEGLATPSATSNVGGKTRTEKIESYMKRQGIDHYAWDFSRFCDWIAEPRSLMTPSLAAQKEFVKIKKQLIATRDKYLPIWKKKKDHPKPYNLMKLHKPDHRPEQGVDL